MKRRHIVMLVAVAAIVIGCAVLLALVLPFFALRLTDLLPGHSTLAQFKKLVEAERYAEAYQMTTVRFRASVSLKEFEEFCTRRNTERTAMEVLGPDRRKFPQSNSVMVVLNADHLPFSIAM